MEIEVASRTLHNKLNIFSIARRWANFEFLAGTYKLTVFAKLVGNSKSHELASLNLLVSESQAAQLSKPNTGIYFDWGPDQQSYHAHIDERPQTEHDIEQLLETMANKKSSRRHKPARLSINVLTRGDKRIASRFDRPWSSFRIWFGPGGEIVLQLKQG